MMFGGWGARQAVSASSDSFKNPGMNEATEGLRMDARLGNVAPRNRAMATGNTQHAGCAVSASHVAKCIQLILTVNVSPRHSDPPRGTPLDDGLPRNRFPQDSRSVPIFCAVDY